MAGKENQPLGIRSNPIEIFPGVTTKKRGKMFRANQLVGGDLARFLQNRYYAHGGTLQGIAEELFRLSEGHLVVGVSMVGKWMKRFNFSTRTLQDRWKDEAIRGRVVQGMHTQERRKPKDNK